MQDVDLDIAPECAVCMLTMVTPTQLPCKHVFCQGCAHASMNFKWECPMCRFVPARTFNFAISAEIKEELKAKTEPELWEERVEQVASFPKIKVQRPEAA